ncbi:MAG: hypothetical protein AAFR50_00660 [Pseudomonadota bacterium]
MPRDVEPARLERGHRGPHDLGPPDMPAAKAERRAPPCLEVVDLGKGMFAQPVHPARMLVEDLAKLRQQDPARVSQKERHSVIFFKPFQVGRYRRLRDMERLGRQ